MADGSGKTAEQDGSITLAGLPEWDLSDLYGGPEAPELKTDLAEADRQAKAFRADYEGKLAGLPGSTLAEAIGRYEQVQELLGRLMSYGQLLQSGNVSDAKIAGFYQGLQEQATRISTNLLFFTLELNRLEDEVLEPKLADPAMAHWLPWLRDLRVYRPHQLSDELERLLHEKYVVGRAAWNRLFDETMAGLRFPLDGKLLTSTEILNRFTDRSPKVREAAAHAFAKVLADNQRGSSPSSPTRWPRTRRSRTSGATSRARSPAAISPTWSRTRWSTP